jgi:hypothetical protein
MPVPFNDDIRSGRSGDRGKPEASAPGLTRTAPGVAIGDLLGSKGSVDREITKARAEDAAMSKVGRNEPCPCGSGRKYKKCCMEKHERARVITDPEENRRGAQRKREVDRLGELVREGYSLLSDGSYPKARSFALRWSEKYPQDDRFHDILITSCLNMGELERAADLARSRWKAALAEKEFFLSKGKHSFDGPTERPGHAYSPEAWLERVWVAEKALAYRAAYPQEADPSLVRLVKELRGSDDRTRFPQSREAGLQIRKETLAPVLQAVKEAGPSALPYLLPICTRYSWSALLVPEILVHWGDESSICALVEIAVFHYPFLSESCLKGLEELGERVLPFLAQAFQQDEDFDSLKIGLISVAGQIGTPEALRWVTGLLEHRNTTVVNWAAGVLGKRGHKPALQALRAASEQVGSQPNILWALEELEKIAVADP